MVWKLLLYITRILAIIFALRIFYYIGAYEALNGKIGNITYAFGFAVASGLCLLATWFKRIE